MASSETCALLVAWLSDENATQYDLLRELTRCRLEAQESPMLLEAIRIVAEATSADLASDDIRSEIRDLLASNGHEVLAASASTSTSTGQTIAAS